MRVDWRGVFPAATTQFAEERVRAPRLPLDGDERTRITALIRRAVETGPTL